MTLIPANNMFILQKKYISKNIAFLLSACLFVSPLLSFNPLYAQGVAAGVDISNTAVVSYQIDGVAQAPLNSPAAVFKVDRKIDLSLTGNTHANVSLGDLQAEVTYTLVNEGNDIQEFSLIPDTTLISDNFDISNCNTVVTSITGTPLTSVPTTGNIKLKADQQASISVKCDIPLDNAGSPIINGHTSLLALHATAEKNNDGSTVEETMTADTAMGIETVFVDGAGPDDANRDASFTARRTYTVTTNLQTPVAVDDSSSDHLIGSSVTINPLLNDSNPGDSSNNSALDPTSVVLIGSGVSTDGKSLTVTSEGIWTVNISTGEVTFTPETGFTGDPTPVNYTVKNNSGTVSNQAVISIDYKQTTTPEAALNINKSIVSTVDPQGGNKAISGALVTYKITITTTGTGILNNIVITDPTPAGMTYKIGSIFMNNNNLTDIVNLTDDNDSDNADFGKTHSNTATINLGDITAGSQYEILLSYTIN